MVIYVAKDKEINLLHEDAQDMYRRLVEKIKTGVYMADLKGNMFYVNEAFVEILGYHSKEDLLGHSLASKLYAEPKQRELFLEKIEKRGFVKDYVVTTTKKDGTIVILSVTSHYIKNKKGEVIGVEGVVLDITFQKKLEEDLTVEKRKLEEILGFDQKLSSIRKFDVLIDFIVKKTAEILDASKCSLMLLDEENNDLCIKGALGLDEEIMRKTRIRLGDPIAGVVAQEGEPLHVKNIEYDKRFQRGKRKNYVSRSFMIAPIKLEETLIGLINVADKKPKTHQEEVFSDIDFKILCAISREVAVAIENVKLYRELKYLTTTDPLTHIFNYRQFKTSLNFEIKRRKRIKSDLSLIMIDIDNFKSYNDTYGHLEGDALLKAVGKILKDQLRDTDIVCRYAGDEFVAILPGTNLKGATKVTEKIQDVFQKQFPKKKVSLSQGIAGFTNGMTDYDIILKADRALYQAKKDGKNRTSSLK